MTTVTVRKGSVIVDGHAGYAQVGQDIICAGISCLTFALGERLRQLSTPDLVFDDSTPGKITISYQPTEDAAHAVGFALAGYNMLAQTYPEYVRLAL